MLQEHVQELRGASHHAVAEAVGQRVAEVMVQSHTTSTTAEEIGAAIGERVGARLQEALRTQTTSQTTQGGPGRGARAKLAEPEAYRGEPGDLRRFITAAREYYAYYISTSSEEDLIRILAGRLQDGPGHWVQGEIEQARVELGKLPWPTVDRFLKSLGKVWSDPNEAFNAYERISSIKLTEFSSWVEFLNEMRRLWSIVHHPAHLKAHAIVRALPKDSALIPTLGAQDLWVTWRSDPTSMTDEQFVQFHRMIGAAVRNIVFNKQGTGSPSSPLSIPSSSASTESRTSYPRSNRNKAEGHARLFAIMAEYRKKLGPEVFKRLRDSGACFRCHREDCPGAAQCTNTPARINLLDSAEVLEACEAAGYSTSPKVIVAAMKATPEEPPPVPDNTYDDVTADQLARIMELRASDISETA